MNFTYQAYQELIEMLYSHGYSFRDYHNYFNEPKCVILRHDIDNSLEQAIKLAELENRLGVSSTWFVLLRTDFYNVASREGQKALQYILQLGHQIGLHFDELAYPNTLTLDDIRNNVIEEVKVLSLLLKTRVLSVSMHRPSQAALDSNLQLTGIVNSYEKVFFSDFKYLSDSRRRWREPVLDIIRSEKYNRLHILTHAFWYHEVEQSISESVASFVMAGNRERYYQIAANISDIDSILGSNFVQQL